MRSVYAARVIQVTLLLTIKDHISASSLYIDKTVKEDDNLHGHLGQNVLRIGSSRLHDKHWKFIGRAVLLIFCLGIYIYIFL